MKKTATPQRIYEIKVTLLDAEPPIWRRLQVGDGVSLGQFHDILQTVMGWTDSHLHQFIKGKTFYGAVDPLFDGEDEAKTKLRDVLQRSEDRLVYEYDFGDGWTHEIVLERITAAAPGCIYPHVLGGERACPPEDCGGIPGYYYILEALKNPRRSKYKEILAWIEPDYDPEAFDAQATNQVLRRTALLVQ